MSAKTGVVASADLEDIEIDLHGETKYWQPSASYPTRNNVNFPTGTGGENYFTEPNYTAASKRRVIMNRMGVSGGRGCGMDGRQ